MRTSFLWLLAALTVTAAVAVGLANCSVNVELPERFALVYGIEAYTNTYSSDPATNPSPNLDYSADDAKAVCELLLAKGYLAANTILRTDSAASKAQLILDIAAIAAKAGKDSLFVFFYSGHGGQATYSAFTGDSEPGDQDSSTEFIVPYGGLDPSASYMRILPANLVSDDELMRLIAQVPSRNKVVLIDACNSGGFIGASPATDGGSASEAFSKYFANVDQGDIAYTEAVVVTASGETKESYEVGTYPLTGVTYNHGLFTYYLLKTSARADKNKDGWITAGEVYVYAKDRMQDDWGAYGLKPYLSGGALDFALFEAD